MQCVKELCKKFTKIEFKHIFKIRNEFADAFATMIQHTDKNYIDPIEIEIMDQHAYCYHVDKEPDGKPLYHDIKRFLETRKYPENATKVQKRALKRLTNYLFLNREVLYMTLDLGLLRCVDAVEATRLLEEIHAGTFRSHMNGFTLAKKILRAGYFFMTMESDRIRYVQKCHQCHIQRDLIWVPPNELNVMGLA
ncbi:uncharacterized protein [Nicotiana tomentosiformis]|uniref:uncharacterized protein n=1 Tax=Nicotiana tomentosiformis TaxID=4098 RepID=UPI00051C46E5|nr:uncharacterized protein LOC104104466 [Nicotiana tomentosiformis]